MNVSDLKAMAGELRRIIDRELDDAEIKKGMSEAARNKGIAFAQLKSLVKAQAQDARDGKNRVKALVDRATFASDYAGILSGQNERKTESRSSDNSSERTDEAKAREVTAASGSGSAATLAAISPLREDHGSQRQAGVGSERSSLTRTGDPGPMPEFLIRRAEAST